MAFLPAIAVIASAAASVVGGVSAIVQGRQSAKLAEQAGRYNVAQIKTETAVKEAQLRRDRLRRLGAFRAAVAGRGMTLSGSPLAVMADQVAEAEEEALLLRYAGESRASATWYSAQVQAARYKAAGLNEGLTKFGMAGASILGGFATGAFSGLGGAGSGVLQAGEGTALDAFGIAMV